MLGTGPVAAGNFVQTYLAAHGGCSNPAWSPLAFVLTGQDFNTPFGKPAAEWSDDDFAMLKSALAACRASMVQTGNLYTLQEIDQQSDDALKRIPQIVAGARSTAAAETQQVEARRQMAAARIDRAAQAKQQAKASAEAEADRLEREATAAEADMRDVQRRLDQRVRNAARARDEAQTKAAAIAGMERQAEEDAALLPRALPAARGEISELAPADEAMPGGKSAGPLTVTAGVDTPACRSIDDLAAPSASSPGDTAYAAPGASTACRRLAKGTQATVQAAAANASMRAFCVTLAGQPGCFWVAKGALEEPGPR